MPITQRFFQTRTVSKRGVFILALLLFATPVFATHDVDHRFVVYGTVRDDRGNPVADAKVIVADSRVNEGMTAFTGRNGDYDALLHLHNTDLGDEITVTALGERKTIRAEFDPNDKTTPRKVRVDFGAAPNKTSGSKKWYEGKAVLGTAMVVGAAVAVTLLRRYQRKRRMPQKARKKK